MSETFYSVLVVRVKDLSGWLVLLYMVHRIQHSNTYPFSTEKPIKVVSGIPFLVRARYYLL